MRLSAELLLEKLKNIYNSRLIIWEMSVGMFKSKYIGLKLGIWTAVVNPLMVMFAISFVFVKVFQVDIENFPLFVLSGIFPWIFFSSALSEAALSITNRQSLLHQYNFPREVLPLASVISSFFTFLVGCAVIFPIFLAYNPGIIMLFVWFIILLVLMLIFISGLGMILSVLNAIFRDVEQLLSVIMMLWFWITPIFYRPDMVPGPYQIICMLNPVTPFIVFFRHILVYGRLPQLITMISVVIIPVVTISLGVLVFTLCERQLSKEI